MVKLINYVLIVLAAGCLAFAVQVPLNWTNQAILGTLLVAMAVVAGRLLAARYASLLLTFVSIFCTVRYTVWRWTATFGYLNDNGWNVDPWGLLFGFLLLGAEAYAALILLLGYFQSARPLMRRPVPMPGDTEHWPVVDVFIPTYNEPLDVVRPTVLAALGIDWPADKLRVHLLDDGRRSEFKAFAEECGVAYVTRNNNAHAKAGNINNALASTTGEYVAIFDCDHIATRSFLQLTVGWFLKDTRLGMLQTPHHFYSPDPFERNLGVFRKVPNEGSLFYGIVQQGSDLWNATFFCGSCAVLRRTALEQIGGIAVETVTEDAHTSLRMQKLGWNTAYIGIAQSAGLATGSLAAHIGQRIRWARGMVQILRVDCPLFAKGLKLPQRLCYFNSVVHFLYAVPRLIFLTAPLVYLLLGKSNLYGSLWAILAYAMPHLVLASLTNSRVQGSHRHSFWNEVYETILAPYILLPTTFALINPKWGKFNVTSKGSVVDESFFDFKVARPYLFLIALNVLGIGNAVVKYLSHGDPTGVLGINVLWAVVNTLMLGTAVAVATESRQRRASVRIKSTQSARVIIDPQTIYAAQVIDMSEGGVALQLERAAGLHFEDSVEIAIQHGQDEYRFRSEVVGEHGTHLRLRFAATDLEHYRAVTRMIYARADSWIRWTEGQDQDNILQSLIKILSIGLYGIAGLPTAFFKRPAAEQSVEKGASEKSPTIRTAVISGMVLILLLIPALLMRGQELTPAPSQRQPAVAPKEPNPSFHERQNFAALGQQSAITLVGDKAESTVQIGIPGTKVVGEASLIMRYRASNLPIGASLETTLNGSPVGSLPIKSGGASESIATTQMILPSDLFVRDNLLTFRLHTRCDAPCLPTAGSPPSIHIDPTTELITSGLTLRLPNALANLPTPFFDATWRGIAEIPMAFADQPDATLLKAAGVVSSWFGIMSDYRGLHCPVSVGDLPRGNVVLFATSDSPLAAKLGVSVAGPVLAIKDNPADPDGKVLAVLGTTKQEVLIAAQGLALRQFAATGDQASITNLEMPTPRTAYDSPKWLPIDRPVRIAESASTSMLRATSGSPATIYFNLPPDLNFGSRETVRLTLPYLLSGISSARAAEMHLRLNGVFVAKRTLKSGSEVQSEDIALPASLLYASNTLSIALLNSSSASSEEIASGEMLIKRTAELDLHHVTHDVRMPRLDLFAVSGFPFTRFADLSTTLVVLPVHSTPSQLSTYLDTLGFLGSRTGYPALRFEISSAAKRFSVSTRDIILFGSDKDQSLLKQLAPRMPVLPINGGLHLNDQTEGWAIFQNSDWLSLDEVWKRLTAPSSHNVSRERIDLADLLSSDARPHLVVSEMSGPSPTPGSTLLAIATGLPELDDRLFARLGTAAKKGQLQGNTLLLDGDRLRSFQLHSQSYYLHGNDWRQAVNFWMSYHLLSIAVLVFACAAILAWWWQHFLEQCAQERLRA